LLNYSINEIEGLKVLALSGSISAETIGNFTSIIKQVTERENIIINFENVTLVTAAGMDSIVDVSMFAKEHDRRVIILWAEQELMKMAEILGYYDFLIFAQSIDEAKMKISYFT
jgi:anti-anti-sigma regulatory factor